MIHNGKNKGKNGKELRGERYNTNMGRQEINESPVRPETQKNKRRTNGDEKMMF